MATGAEPILIAKAERELFLLPAMANRHGLIAGATGTGKTVTLQRLAEGFSRNGVPVFVADVKGDLAGLSIPGEPTPRIVERLSKLGIEPTFNGYPTTFWDIFGEKGHPMRATVSEMGPLLLSRLLDLNDIQTGVLSLSFRIADDQGLLLLDLNDLRSMLKYVGENSKSFTVEYGSVSPASIGAIQRALLTLEEQGGGHLFGEPALALSDIMLVDADGRGRINILAADRLFGSPTMYATYLLWLLSELFEQMPEIGDVEKPRLVFFFDEAHLLFDDAPKALQDKIEQVVRLIRSKGVGVYFVTQNPLDIPDEILGQLGNRVQHALRAYTPRDQKAVKAAATTFRTNPALDVESAITELEVGEALVSMLDDKGRPSVVERALIVPPTSHLGVVSPEQRAASISASPLHGRYENMVDRESAHELLKARAESALADADATRTAAERAKSAKEHGKQMESQAKADAKLEAADNRELAAEVKRAERAQRDAARERQRDSPLDGFVKSATRAIGSSVGRQIVRGILGSILGGRR